MSSKSKKTKSIKADDYYSFGPIEIARFGKYIECRSNLTKEQFDDLQAELCRRFPEVCQEIDDKIYTIVNEVKKYSPTDLLKRGYWEMAGNHLNLSSEIEIDKKATTSLRMIDYIQSIIASVPARTTDLEELTEEKFFALQKLVGALFNQLNEEYQICRTAFIRYQNDDFDSNFDEYLCKAQLYWCNVRGQRYLFHEKNHFEDLLLVHSDILNELFGITAEQLIDGIGKIQSALSEGVIEAGSELKKFYHISMEAIESRLSDTENFSENSLPDLLEEVVKENDWEEWQSEIFGRFFDLELFDLEKVTNIPKNLLEKLSWSQGQDVEFFAEGEFRGWPLRIWPVFKRPFIKLNDRYYCFELNSLFDNLYRILQKIICQTRTAYREEWNKKQKEISEQLPFKYFKKILPSAKVYQSVNYRWYPSNKHTSKDWCETDGLIISDDHLFIIEVKAGAFTYTSPANDFPAYIESLKQLLFKPAEQGNRFLAYLSSQETVDLFDYNHKKIGEISKKDFEHTQVCAITLDPFTELASQSQHLSKIGVNIGSHPVWSISIDDLRVYSDIFDNSLFFLHFIEQRMRAFSSDLIKTDDELDHLGLYLHHNIYTLHAQDFNLETPLQWYGYRSEIDAFFTEKLHDPQTPCPLRQNIPSRLAEIIDLLNRQKSPGRRKVSSMLLDFGGTERNTIGSMIDDALTQQQKTGQSKPLTMHGVYISIFCWQQNILNRKAKIAEEHTIATMLMAGDKERLLLEIFFDRAGIIYNIEFKFIKRESIDENELKKLKIVAETLRRKRIEKAKKADGKIGRNDTCPCGSGKKYKKCCLGR